jgi:hypothetical protein
MPSRRVAFPGSGECITDTRSEGLYHATAHTCLDTLTALQTLLLGDCFYLQQMQPLHSLKSLKTLQGGFGQLQQWPGLDSRIHLQTLVLFDSEQLNTCHAWLLSQVCLHSGLAISDSGVSSPGCP